MLKSFILLKDWQFFRGYKKNHGNREYILVQKMFGDEDIVEEYDVSRYICDDIFGKAFFIKLGYRVVW